MVSVYFKVNRSMTVPCLTVSHLVIVACILQRCLVLLQDVSDELVSGFDLHLFAQLGLLFGVCFGLRLGLVGKLELALSSSRGLRLDVVHALEWARVPISDSKRHELIKEYPGMVTTGEDAIDVLLLHRVQKRESSASRGVTQAQLSILVVAADVHIALLSTGDTVVQASCDQLDLLVTKVLNEFRFVDIL